MDCLRNQAQLLAWPCRIGRCRSPGEEAGRHNGVNRRRGGEQQVSQPWFAPGTQAGVRPEYGNHAGTCLASQNVRIGAPLKPSQQNSRPVVPTQQHRPYPSLLLNSQCVSIHARRRVPPRRCCRRNSQRSHRECQSADVRWKLCGRGPGRCHLARSLSRQCVLCGVGTPGRTDARDILLIVTNMCRNPVQRRERIPGTIAISGGKPVTVGLPAQACGRVRRQSCCAPPPVTYADAAREGSTCPPTHSSTISSRSAGVHCRGASPPIGKRATFFRWRVPPFEG